MVFLKITIAHAANNLQVFEDYFITILNMKHSLFILCIRCKTVTKTRVQKYLYQQEYFQVY
jgi:hypothetical protein